MSIKFVYQSLVKVTDNKVFTEAKVKKWRNHILNSYVLIFNIIKTKIDPISPVKFFLTMCSLKRLLPTRL